MHREAPSHGLLVAMGVKDISIRSTFLCLYPKNLFFKLPGDLVT